MTHNSRCERANPANKCRCSCGGKYHGTAFGKEIEIEVPRVMTSDMGGSLGKVISELWGKSHFCTCGREMILVDFKGVLNPFLYGLKDSDGTSWHATATCPECKKKWPVNQIVNRIKFWGC